VVIRTALVAQICNLPYRGIGFCGPPIIQKLRNSPKLCRLQIGDTAECNSALRSVGVRRIGWLAPLAIVMLLLSLTNAFANVTVTPATGGTSLSSDTAADGITPTWKALTTITIDETNGNPGRNEISAGTNVTLILKTPAGFEFNTGATLSISFTAGRDITAGSAVVTDSTTITITLTVSGVSNNDTLTISGLQVRPTDAGPLAVARNIYRPTTGGGTAVIAGIVDDATGSSGTSFGALSQSLGAFTKLQILAPGETAAPGTPSGKTGTPSAQTAGTAFNVTVNAVDSYWNVVSTNHTVGITSSDANAVLPANAALVAGTRSLSVTFKTGGTQTVTATDITNGAKAADTSSSIPVNAGVFVKMQLLVPGETASPGSASGKTGTPSAASAGTAFNVTVNGVDANWNVVNTVTHTVALTSTDVNATLPANIALVAGTRILSVTLRTLGTRTLTVTDITDGTKTANTSPSITVNLGPFAKLQILLPGETAAAGTVTGKTGTPTAQTSGTAFNVTVNAVDAAWNLVSSTHTVGITSSDANAALPVNAALVAGTKIFSVTLKTVGAQTLTATDITDGTKTADVSSPVTVNAGVFTKMQLLVPGETAAPGTVAGKTGTPSVATAGTAFNVTVNAVDANWNLVSTNHTVGITSTDPNAALPANAALVAGTGIFSVTLKTAGTRTVTATDITNGTKTANTSPSITVNVGAFTKMQLLVPGEAAAPGTVSGKTGTPTVETAGTAFNVTVNAVDANWNLVSTNHTVGITSSDPNATLPSNTALVAGTGIFSVTLRTVGTRTVTATDITDGTKTANTSPLITVNAGAFTKLQILVPGETASPGSATGKTGTPTVATNGTAFNVTVNAVDANWNLVSTNHTVGITSSDANATLPANAALVGGTKIFSVTLKTAGTRTVTATDITDGTKTANTSPPITVNVGAFTKMQLLVPGETAAPGTVSGKTGTPTSQVTGVGFSVTVNAVDANWNLVTSVTNVVAITSSDGTASLPGNTPLVGGTQSLSVTLRIAGNSTVTASDVTQGAHTPDTSPAIQVIQSPTVSGFVYLDANRNSVKDGAETGTGLVVFAKIYPAGTPSGPAQQVVAVNLTTGAFSFLNLTNGTYFIALDNNNSPSDVTPTLPSGWIGTEIQNQLRSSVVLNGADLANQSFGLIQSAAIRGSVFKDTGVGGGTANDGIKNGSEPGLSGVSVKLLDGGGGVVDSATTDGSGNYVLVVPGSVAGGAQLRITESNLSAYRSTGATVGDTGGAYNSAGDFVSFTFSSGFSYVGVNFGDVPENQFTTGSPQSGPAGSVVFYAHAFTAGTAGQVTFTANSVPSPANSGWSNVLFRDNNCNGQVDSGEPMITGALSVAADEKICVIVKEFIPANAPFNAQDQITLTAQFSYTGSNPPVSAMSTGFDVTTVGTSTSAGLTLTKAVDKATASPGETITYTITYLNNSASLISNVIIFDSTPAFTTFLSATAGTLPSSLTGSVIVKPSVAGKGPIRWTFSGSLDPGQSGSVHFSVAIE
jgi:hypothetical protein